jgi:hypothetical protein
MRRRAHPHAIFFRPSDRSAAATGTNSDVSNGSAAAAFLVAVAALTGMSHTHGAVARRHADRQWAAPERAELGDVRIPVRTVRRRHIDRDLAFHRSAEATPEVIVGYVDPARGSSAFHRLTNVVEGDRVKVVRHDDSIDWYRVDSVREAVRRNIDRERSATGRPELRLISWRGPRNPRNVVVSAHLDRPAARTVPPVPRVEKDEPIPDGVSR